jgi:hypothetical protein
MPSARTQLGLASPRSGGAFSLGRRRQRALPDQQRQ